MPKKLTYEFVKSVFERKGCTLLSPEYINSKTKLEYICTCGEKSTTVFTNFQKGHKCVKCGNKSTASKSRKSLSTVSSIFEDAGCKLTSEVYVNNQTPLDYICVCGKASKTSLSNFQKGVRCMECGISKLKGENNYQWNPNKEKDDRNTPEYREWRKAVLHRDEYMCQKCGELHWAITAHHIINFKDNVEHRYDVDNGITLCRKCHSEFHTVYGFHNVNGAQLLEYLSEKDESNPWYAGEVFE